MNRQRKKNVSSNPVPQNKARSVTVADVAPVLLDLYSALALVLGGCCSNVVTYEQLLVLNPRIGSALTFSQMLFITLHHLPAFLTSASTKNKTKTKKGSLSRLLPQRLLKIKLKPRQVPLGQWALQVMVLTTGSLLNNWAFAYNVPLTVLIVFRSAGLPISMLFGYLFANKQYSPMQVLSIIIVTVGVTLVTLSGSSSSSGSSASMTPEELTKYTIGIGMMVVSLLCTGVLGMMQEKTYKTYGPCWKEGVFYTHALSLPAFLFLRKDIESGLRGLIFGSNTSPLRSLTILGANLLTQLVCVSGVNKLSSQVSSVSTNIALTARKALSLCLSVWFFGNEWNLRLGSGAAMVFFGSLLYSLNVGGKSKRQ